MSNHFLDQNFLLTPKVLQSLQTIPAIAAARGRGLVVLQDGKVQYFPLSGKQRLPQKLINILLYYKPKTQVLIASSLCLNDDTSYMVMDVKPVVPPQNKAPERFVEDVQELEQRVVVPTS